MCCVFGLETLNFDSFVFDFITYFHIIAAAAAAADAAGVVVVIVSVTAFVYRGLLVLPDCQT